MVWRAMASKIINYDHEFVEGCKLRAPALIERASLQDLDFDSLNHIFSKQNLFLIRSLSKGIKDRVDNTPLAAIKLSAEGTKQATASFFSSFQGLLMIESQHGWSASAGWFRSYLDTGLNPNHELSLDIDDSNIHVLLENFTKSYLTLGKSTKMRRHKCCCVRATASMLRRESGERMLRRECCSIRAAA